MLIPKHELVVNQEQKELKNCFYARKGLLEGRCISLSEIVSGAEFMCAKK